ncbi:hypothetical protein HYC85_015107 [Camellia sinensis]|uniref:Leucine-rich repeat-containing N-terminal plant-type domain-containing protein n=1 Tax=Camellia sinensis TaxID=4442 RepID=A0A7J7H897_CAMSI|nr:hypothetical protein HYC85_015107 [Camellia sinensis]
MAKIERSTASHVEIGSNKLSGQIPVNIGDLTRLVALSFAGNQLSGPIPSSISKLTQLGQLKFGGNLLTGTVPPGIQQLKKLTLLSLDRNQLTGTVPDIFSVLTELLPKSFGNLTKIFNLDLSHNFLVDPFPEMNVKGIESLDLSYNGFHLSEIPKWVTSSTIIYCLKLARCGIKIKLDDWKPVETYFYDYIDLSDNEISGSPVGLLNQTNYLVGFRALGNRIRFDMESKHKPNKALVFGKLPKAISGLETLNLSNNHLCGSIPPNKFPVSSFSGNDCLCGFPLSPSKGLLVGD